MRRLGLWGSGLLLLGAVWATPSPPYRPPSEAIPFNGPLLDGGQFDLNDYLGKKPLVINFWASWCRPCRLEAEVLERFFREYSEAVAFVSVDVQDPGESARAFVKRYGITFPIVQDGGADVAWAYRVTGLPTTFFIDLSGRILFVHRGPLIDEQLLRYLQHLLEPAEAH